MPRVIRTEQESAVSLPFILAPSNVKPVTYIPEYKQMGFQFDQSEDDQYLIMEYTAFVPFLFSFPGRHYCTYSEFAIRNGFRLETGKEIAEDLSKNILEVLVLAGKVNYIFSEFHNAFRWASIDMKQAVI